MRKFSRIQCGDSIEPRARPQEKLKQLSEHSCYLPYVIMGEAVLSSDVQAVWSARAFLRVNVIVTLTYTAKRSYFLRTRAVNIRTKGLERV